MPKRPTVRVEPDPVPVGSENIDIIAAGLTPGEEYGIRFYSVGFYPYTVKADKDGGFTVAFPHRWDTPDEYQVQVDSSRRTEAVGTFTVA